MICSQTSRQLRLHCLNDTRHELDKYFALPVTDSNVLQFWKENDGEYKLPTMAMIARKLLAIPATSTASERVFSVCGVTMSSRRARLSPETLEMLIFQKYNMQPPPERHRRPCWPASVVFTLIDLICMNTPVMLTYTRAVD